MASVANVVATEMLVDIENRLAKFTEGDGTDAETLLEIFCRLKVGLTGFQMAILHKMCDGNFTYEHMFDDIVTHEKENKETSKLTAICLAKIAATRVCARGWHERR